MLKFLSALFMNVTLRVSPSSALSTGPGQMQKNTVTRREELRGLWWKTRHQYTNKYTIHTSVRFLINQGKEGKPYLRVLSVENQVLVFLLWWRYCPCTLCISLSGNDLRFVHHLCQKTPLMHYERKGWREWEERYVAHDTVSVSQKEWRGLQLICDLGETVVWLFREW